MSFSRRLDKYLSELEFKDTPFQYIMMCWLSLSLGVLLILFAVGLTLTIITLTLVYPFIALPMLLLPPIPFVLYFMYKKGN